MFEALVHLKSHPVNRSACDTTPLCGQLPANPVSFSDRISPRCATLLNVYRSIWADLQISNFVTHPQCGALAPSGATNPAVVSSNTNTTATFVLCTVPKSGCTNLRKLMNTIVSDPSAAYESTDAFGQFYGPHIAGYPNVWHYTIPDRNQTPPPHPATAALPPTLRRSLHRMWGVSGPPTLWLPTETQLAGSHTFKTHAARVRDPVRSTHSMPSKHAPEHMPPTAESAPETTSLPPQIPATIPTFIVSRNPYVRMLSGFLDKMVHNPARHDVLTYKYVNRHLRFPDETRWQASVRDFHSFVRALALRGVSAVNSHFRPAVALCTETLKYDYYLRLEEMEEWFPCWMDGLGLREWTERGWANTPHGRMYVGEGWHFVTLNSFNKTRETRPQWDQSKGRASSGEEGVDWAWVEGSQCWWSPSHMSCAEYYTSFTREGGVIEPGSRMAESGGGGRRVLGDDDSGEIEDDIDPMEGDDGSAAGSAGGSGGIAARDGGAESAVHDKHDTQSQTRWHEYYTQEIADLVFLLYSKDFAAFGYSRYVVLDPDADPT